MTKKYYDGGIVTEILFTHLEAEKMLELLTAFAEATGIDAVEVIRCKDCIYWQDNNGGYPHEDCKWREDETPDADDWCSGAERKAIDALRKEEHGNNDKQRKTLHTEASV